MNLSLTYMRSFSNRPKARRFWRHNWRLHQTHMDRRIRANYQSNAADPAAVSLREERRRFFRFKPEGTRFKSPWNLASLDTLFGHIGGLKR